MKELHIGTILAQSRRRRGITQDALAEYIGVSKASVSKWETEATYPDITLLPRLAAFFNISIDELMGYEPQMAKTDIRRLYRRLCAEFVSLPFDEAVDHCRSIAREYFSCMPLLFEIGSLYVNHSMLAGSPEKTSGILEEARALFRRVREESDSIELARQALSMEALCLLHLGHADDAYALLKPLQVSLTSPVPLLAQACQATGRQEEAKSILQVGIYQSIVEIIGLLSAYMPLCAEDEDAFCRTWQRALSVIRAFQLEGLHPSLLFTLYLSAAQGFMSFGRKERALDLLEQYAALATSDIYPLRLHGDSYFNLLDEWLEASLTRGSDLPRDESIVRKSMTQAVADNPLFAPLASDPRFQGIVRRLKENEEVRA